ncbi:MAG: hypothetical protein JSS81_26790 [Acidobacteria bacterium]|nr:hypothetical protein [Acidobacteriota bacterium]
MSFNPQRLKKAFYAFSSVFKKQTAFDVPLADEDLDSRHNCSVTFEDVVERETIYDCGQEDVFDEETTAQLKRVRLSYASITPQRLFGWICLFLSSTAGATGTAQNEVQTITSDATGGTFTATFAFEGLTGTTGALAYNVTAANFKKALEALASIGPGNIASVTGTLATGFVVTFGGQLAKTNVPLLSIGAGSLTGNTGAPTVVQTTAGGNKYHAATRSSDDALAKTSMACGWEGNSDNPKKYFNMVVESITITLNRRKLVTVEVVCLARFTPEELTGFSEPDCENLPGLKGAECKIKVNSNYLIEEFWQATIVLNNTVPTGDDAFPFSGIEVANFERGDKPTYPISMQILGSGRDTVGTLIEDETKVPVEFLMGLPGNRASLIFPNVLMKFASTPSVYVGEKNRSAHSIEATPHKDATLHAPLRAEAYLDQTEQFAAV